MNPRLAGRPLDPKRRLPVPYSQLINEDGTANFAAIDGVRSVECGRQRKCGLCGQPLGSWVAFLGGPGSVAAGSFADPPMHLGCAKDATVLCPHIAHQRVPRRPDSDVGVPTGWVEDKPARYGLLVTRGYRLVLDRESQMPVFLAHPAERVEWYHYINNQLVPEEEEHAD